MHQCSSSIRGGLKHLFLIILMIHVIFPYDQNISEIIYVKMDSMSGCDIRFVITLLARDSTLQYKKCVHLWNNFPCVSTLVLRDKQFSNNRNSIIRIESVKNKIYWTSITASSREKMLILKFFFPSAFLVILLKHLKMSSVPLSCWFGRVFMSTPWKLSL